MSTIHGFKEQSLLVQVWLQPGDVVEVDIDQVGVLRNVVVDEEV